MTLFSSPLKRSFKGLKQHHVQYTNAHGEEKMATSRWMGLWCVVVVAGLIGLASPVWAQADDERGLRAAEKITLEAKTEKRLALVRKVSLCCP